MSINPFRFPFAYNFLQSCSTSTYGSLVDPVETFLAPAVNKEQAEVEDGGGWTVVSRRKRSGRGKERAIDVAPEENANDKVETTAESAETKNFARFPLLL